MNKVLSFLFLLTFLNIGAVSASESCITGFACRINSGVTDSKTDKSEQKNQKDIKIKKNIKKSDVKTDKNTKSK